jgi:hypothetical protein
MDAGRRNSGRRHGVSRVHWNSPEKGADAGEQEAKGPSHAVEPVNIQSPSGQRQVSKAVPFGAGVIIIQWWVLHFDCKVTLLFAWLHSLNLQAVVAIIDRRHCAGPSPAPFL